MKRLILIALAASAWTGCATPPSLLPSIDPSEDSPKTGLLLHSDLETQASRIQAQGCTLEIQGTGSAGKLQLAIPAGKHTLLVEVPAGKYQFQALNCPKAVRWQLGRISERLHSIEPGKISFAGILDFEFRGETESLVVRPGDRERTLDALRADLRSLSARLRKSLISATSGLPITPEMTESRKSYAIDVTTVTRSASKNANTRKLLNQLKACEETQERGQQLMVGHLGFLARYRAGKIETLEKTLDASAFPPAFPACLESAFREFKPDTKAELEIRFSY